MRRRTRRRGGTVRKECNSDPENWGAFGVHPAQVAGWEMLGFDPFEAAMAQGDGFTPAIADHYLRQLRTTADRWKQVGLDSRDGLHWHQAGFNVKETLRFRATNHDVSSAMAIRARYVKDE